MSDKVFDWFIVSLLLFLLVMALVSLHGINSNKRHGTVEAYLEPVTSLKPLSVAPKEFVTNEKVEPAPTWGMYKVPVKITMSDADKKCLAWNIYKEAAYEPHIGKIAVAQITYNRVKQGQKRWGDTVCSVVYSKEQFSWTNKSKTRMSLPHGKPWEAAQDAVRAFTNGTRVARLERSDHYHGDYISLPDWAKEMPRTAKIGHHVFYSSR